MQGSLAGRIALTFGAVLLLASHTVQAEGDLVLEGSPLMTSLDVDGSGAQLVTVLDIGSGVGVFEGDVLVPVAPGVSPRSAGVQAQSFSVALGGSLWPDGIMPYAFDSNLTSSARAKIEQAIEHWNNLTPVRLVERTNQSDYVNFVNKAGCASFIGRQGGGQPIYSSANCSMGNFIHEIGHALGLYHEHTRPDRDDFVTVNWSNISSSKSQNFDIVNSNIQVNTPYDYGSIMHYGKSFFSINGQETITPKQPGASIGQRVALSDDDITGINMLYSSGFDASVDLLPAKPMANANMSANIELSNVTGSSLQSLSVVSELPVGVSFQSAEGTSWSCSLSSRTLTCTGPNLQNGASTDLELSMTAPSSVSNLNFAFNFSASNSSGVDLDTSALKTRIMSAVNNPPEIELAQRDVALVPFGSLTTAIARVKAEDPNGHSLSNFSLTPHSHPGVFEIDANTGDIFATDADAVNALDGEIARLGVTVSDGFAYADETIVEIEMTTAKALAKQGGSGSNGSSGGGVFTALWLAFLMPLRQRRSLCTRTVSNT